jgi:hypothetical protein
MKCPRGNENPNNNYWPAMKSKWSMKNPRSNENPNNNYWPAMKSSQ